MDINDNLDVNQVVLDHTFSFTGVTADPVVRSVTVTSGDVRVGAVGADIQLRDGAIAVLGAGNVSLTANFVGHQILDVDGGAAISITAPGHIQLTAHAGIGTAANPLRIAAGSLTTTSADSGQFLAEADTVDVSGLNAGAGVVRLDTGTFSLSQSNVIHEATTVHVNGGTLEIGGFSDTVGGVTLTSGSISGTTGVLTSASDYELHSGSVAAVLDGAVGLNKTTGGTVTLTRANTYTGATSIEAGTLAVSDNAALGSTTGGTTVASEAVLELRGGITIPEALNLSGVLSSATFGNTWSGVITLASGSSLHANAAPLALTGKVTGSGGLTKTGTAALTLSNTASDYTGTTDVQAGFLYLGASGVIPDTSTVNVNAGAQFGLEFSDETIDALTGTGMVRTDFSGSVLLTVGAAGGSGTFGGIIQNGHGTVGLAKIGAGTQSFAGTNANTYTGTTTIENGMLALAKDAGTNAIAANVVVQTGGALRLMNSDQIADTATVDVDGGTFNLNNQSETIARLIDTNDTGTVSNAADNSAGALVTSTLTVGDGTAFAFDGVLTDNDVENARLALTKVGIGTFTLSGSNTYDGATNVSQGVLSVGNASALGSTAAGTLVQAGAGLALEGNTTVNGEPLILNGAGVADAGALRNSSGFNTWNGPIVLGSASTIVQADQSLLLQGNIDNGGFNLTYDQSSASTHSGMISGNISGSGAFIKTGTQQVTFSGGAKSYTGKTTITQGTITLVGNATLGDTTEGTSIHEGARLIITEHAPLQLENLTVTGAGIGGSGAIPVKWTPVFGPPVKVDFGCFLERISWRHQEVPDGADTTSV